MRHRRRSSIALVLAATAALAAPAGTALADPPGTGQPGEYRPVRGPSAPAEHRFLQKTVRGETLPRHAYDLAAEQANRLPTVGGNWRAAGPTNIGGPTAGPAP